MQIKWSINRLSSPARRDPLFLYKKKPNTETLTLYSCNSCNLRIIVNFPPPLLGSPDLGFHVKILCLFVLCDIFSHTCNPHSTLSSLLVKIDRRITRSRKISTHKYQMNFLNFGVTLECKHLIKTQMVLIMDNYCQWSFEQSKLKLRNYP